MAKMDIGKDIELGEIALILGAVAVGGFVLYKALDKLGILDLAKTSRLTGDDESFVSKVYDNTFSVDTQQTKQGYGPTLSEAAIDFWSHPWDGTKAILGIN